MHRSTIDRANFILLSLGATVLRMLIAIFAMTIGLLADVEEESLFIINFFIIYLFYLIFELIFVLSNLRPN